MYQAVCCAGTCEHQNLGSSADSAGQMWIAAVDWWAKQKNSVKVWIFCSCVHLLNYFCTTTLYLHLPWRSVASHWHWLLYFLSLGTLWAVSAKLQQLLIMISLTLSIRQYHWAAAVALEALLQACSCILLLFAAKKNSLHLLCSMLDCSTFQLSSQIFACGKFHVLWFSGVKSMGPNIITSVYFPDWG